MRSAKQNYPFMCIAAVNNPHTSWRQTSHLSQGQCPKFLRPVCPWGGCQSCSLAGSVPWWKIINLTIRLILSKSKPNHVSFRTSD